MTVFVFAAAINYLDGATGGKCEDSVPDTVPYMLRTELGNNDWSGLQDQSSAATPLSTCSVSFANLQECLGSHKAQEPCFAWDLDSHLGEKSLSRVLGLIH